MIIVLGLIWMIIRLDIRIASKVQQSTTLNAEEGGRRGGVGAAVGGRRQGGEWQVCAGKWVGVIANHLMRMRTTSFFKFPKVWMELKLPPGRCLQGWCRRVRGRTDEEVETRNTGSRDQAPSKCRLRKPEHSLQRRKKERYCLYLFLQRAIPMQSLSSRAFSIVLNAWSSEDRRRCAREEWGK